MNYLLFALRVDYLLVATFMVFAISDAVYVGFFAMIVSVVGAYFSYKAKVFSEEAKTAVNGITHEMIRRAEEAAKAMGKKEGKEEAEVVAAKVTVAIEAAKPKL